MLAEVLLPPLMPAIKTLRLVNTDDFAAPGAGPPLLLISNKMPYTGRLYISEILDHTHAILRSIAVIQSVQPVTRKAVTAGAILDFTFRYLLTALNFACDTGFRFKTVVIPATGACVFISFVCTTKATVHSAGSDQFRMNRTFLFRSNFRHVLFLCKTMVMR